MLRLLTTLTFLVFGSQFANASSTTAGATCNGASYDTNRYLCQPTNIRNADGSTTESKELKEIPGVSESRKKCEDAMDEVRESTKRDSDFRKACTAVTRATDAKTCIEAANFCERCIGTSEDEAEDAGCQDGNSDDDDSDDNEGVNGLSEIIAAARRGQQAQQGTIIDQGKVRRMKQRFNNCPLYSKDEFDDIVDAREKHKEGMKEGQELLEEKMAELKTAQRELGDLQSEQAKIPDEYTEEFNKIVGEENQKLQDQLERAGDQLVELILNTQTAEMQYIDAKNSILKICFDQAQAALDRLKADRRAKISSGQLRSRNGFVGLARQTSTEQKLENYAKKVQKRCEKKNSEVKKQLASAARVFDQTLKRLNLQKQKLEAQINTLSNQLMNATENPEEKRRLDELKETFEQRTEDIGKQIAEKMEQLENLGIVIARIQDELQENKTLYAHYLDQEKQISRRGTPGEKSDTPDDFLAKIEAYEGALYQAFKKCECETSETTGENTNCSGLRRDMDRYFGDGETDGSGVTRVREGANR